MKHLLYTLIVIQIKQQQLLGIVQKRFEHISLSITNSIAALTLISEFNLDSIEENFSAIVLAKMSKIHATQTALQCFY